MTLPGEHGVESRAWLIGADRPKYRTIVADPPWDYGSFATIVGRPHQKQRASGDERKGRVQQVVQPYAALSVTQIAELQVFRLAEKDANLFLWTTNRFLPDAFHVASAWGFTYKQLVVWEKPPGSYLPFSATVSPNCCEFLLVCRRGSGAPLGRRWSSNVIRVPRSVPTEGGRELPSHSSKPEVFLDLIEQVSPSPYLELFARRQRLGWDTWGNEALEHVAVNSGV